MIDATAEEEACMSARITVAVNKQGKICSVQKAASGGLAPTALLEMLKVLVLGH